MIAESVLQRRAGEIKPARAGGLSYFLNTSDRISLGAFLALNNVEFHIVPFLEALVTIQLDRAVMNEHVWPIVTTNEAVSLRVIEPLHFAFVLSHLPVDLP
jgi:hypothetical protein